MSRFLTLHHPSRAREYYERGFWQRDTFYGLLAQRAAERPDTPAIQDSRQQLTWRELRRGVDGIAAGLRAAGLTTGDRVSIWMSNRIEGIATFLACSREGFACNPSLHRTYTCAEIGRLLERLSARALVTEQGWGSDRATADLDAILGGIASLKAIYTPDTLPQPASDAASLSPCDDPDKVAYLAFTSGTTGIPKCVMHSDNTLLANARDMVKDWGHGPETVLLSLAPITHHIAWVALSEWLLCGGRFVLCEQPTASARLDWIIATGATYVLGVPTHAMDLLAEQKKRGLRRFGDVKVFYMAGAPIPPSVADAFVKQGIQPQNVYGMTENSSHQYTHPSDDVQTVVSTCGRGGPAYEVRLFDTADSNRPVDVGVVGQIGGRGAALMLGYFDNQAATESSFNRDGWFLSGDLGVMDDQGNLRIEGRLKDLIIRGGHNIYPAHIEALAIRHEEVAKAACFPVADVRLGERVCIAVVGAVQPDDLLAHLADMGLSKYDMPEYFLRIDELPVTASGKVLKRELVDMVKRGDASPVRVGARSRNEQVAG